jgi:hypothetical protein
MNCRLNRKKTLLTSEEIKEKLINKGIPFEEYKDERGVFNLDHERMSDLSRFVKAQETDYERGADKTSRKQRCGDCYRKI